MEQYSEKQLKIFQNFYESCRKKEIDPTGSEADKQRALLLAQENADLVRIFGEKLDGGHVEAYRMGKQRVEEQAAAEKKAAKEAKIAEQRRIDEQAAALEKAISKLYGRDKRLFFLQQELDAALKNRKEVKGVVDRYVQRYEQADKGSQGSSWGTMGGIAAGITGSTAVGAVVAADAMNKDTNTRAQNAALKSDLLNQWPIYQSMQENAEARVKAAQAEIEKAKLSLMEEHPLAELMDEISLGKPQIAFTAGNTMLIQIEVSAKSHQIAEVPAVLDGCFVAEIYEGKQKIGEAFLNLPRDGIMTGRQILKGHCLEARPGVSYTVLILPVALWLIEKYKFSTEVPTLEKLIPVYNQNFSWIAIPSLDVSWRNVLEERRLKAERKAEEEHKAAVARAKKNKKIAMIAIPIAVVAIIAGVLIFNVVQRQQEEAARQESYNTGLALLEAGEYDEAVAVFEELGDYQDSAEQIVVAEDRKRSAAYDEAVLLFERGEYDAAASAFEALGNYRDSAEQAETAENEGLYQEAMELYPTEQPLNVDTLNAVLEIMQGISQDYKDTSDIIAEITAAIEQIQNFDGTYRGEAWEYGGNSYIPFFQIDGDTFRQGNGASAEGVRQGEINWYIENGQVTGGTVIYDRGSNATVILGAPGEIIIVGDALSGDRSYQKE